MVDGHLSGTDGNEIKVMINKGADGKPVKHFIVNGKEVDKLPEGMKEHAMIDLTNGTINGAHQKGTVMINAESVKKEWGADYAKFNDLAQKALVRFDPEKKLTGLFSELGLGTHPLVMNLFKQLGSALAEDNANRGGKSTSPAVASHDADLRKMFPNSPEMWPRS